MVDCGGSRLIIVDSWLNRGSNTERASGRRWWNKLGVYTDGKQMISMGESVNGIVEAIRSAIDGISISKLLRALPYRPHYPLVINLGQCISTSVRAQPVLDVTKQRAMVV